MLPGFWKQPSTTASLTDDGHQNQERPRPLRFDGMDNRRKRDYYEAKKSASFFERKCFEARRGG